MDFKKKNLIIIIVVLLYFVGMLLYAVYKSYTDPFGENTLVTRKSKNISNSITVLSSYDNRYMEDELLSFAKKNNIKLDFAYMGDLDIVDELNNNSEIYDAVWLSNSMWLYMLDNTSLTSNSKSISISPLVIGIRKSKAASLNLIGKDITNNEFLKLVMDKKISYVMNSVTSTNSGASAYLGFLNSLAGNPTVLTEKMIDDEKLQNSLINLFKGVERVSGDEEYLNQMFINNDQYEAIIADESSLINLNKELKLKNKEELYLLYPTDGVSINDSTLAYIKNNKNNEDAFLKIQKYLLSDEGQNLLMKKGKRTWYGGVKENVDKSIFNPDWGIDTTKYLNVTKFPSKNVMTYALNTYIELLRKPTHVVFVLDYSGSMNGNGIAELRSAMDYILTYETASKNNLQFSAKDKITLIPFSSKVLNVYSTNNGKVVNELLNNINKQNVGGNTALYDAINKGLDILDKESDDYTKTIIAMTDGEVNVGSFSNLKAHYRSINSNVPIYSITFGNAIERQLIEIANLSNAKVFDGKTDLLKAFKEVRGYN